MPYGSYQYQANNGTIYQVSIPQDFANALGMVAASGSEPYLDATIGPRFAIYKDSAQNSRQAIVGTPNLFLTLPPNLLVSGTLYTLYTAVGQSILQFSQSNVVLALGPAGAAGATGATGPAGPTGPQGPAGTSPLLNATGTITSANIINGGNPTNFNLIAAQGAGTIISVVRMSYFFKHGTAYTGTSNMTAGFNITGAMFNIFSSTDMTGTTDKQYEEAYQLAEALTSVFNIPFVFKGSGALANGTGTIVYNILYQVLTP